MAILINDNTARVEYIATAGQTTFTVPFEFFENSNLNVYNNGVELTYDATPADASEYSVVGAGVTGGGTITLGSPGASLNNVILIVRELAVERLTDFPLAGPFNIESLNSELDRITAVQQNLKTEFDNRVLRLNDNDTPNALNALPSATNRALKLLSFDSAGNPVASAPVSGDASDLATSLSSAAGSGSIGYGSDSVYSDGTVGNELVPRVTIALLADVSPKADKVAFVHDSGKEGHFICRAGTAPTDTQQGIYVASSTANFYWERIWDKIHGHPEWFGAIPNDGSAGAANKTAIEACIALCPVTLLRAADYWLNDTLKIAVQYRTVKGEVLSDGYNTGNGTRLVCTDASKTVVQIGPDSAPAGGTSAYYRNIRVENLCARWSVNLTPPSSGSEANAVKAWNCQYILKSQIKNCAAWEPIVGFYFYGCVATLVDDCTVFRSTTYGGDNDFFRGFWPQGAPVILAGGNPSLFLNRCAVSFGNAPSLVKATGLYMTAGWADIFVDNFETSDVPYGIVCDGTTSTAASGKLDLHIRNVVIDQCDEVGIEIDVLNELGAITIDGGYIQVNDLGTTSYGVWIHGGVNKGQVTIGGGLQLISNDTGGLTNVGIYVSQQSQVSIDETVMLTDWANAIALDGGSITGTVNAVINNPNVGNGTTSAIGLNNADLVSIQPTINGKSGAFANGIYLISTTNDKVSVDPTRVNSSCVTNKVNINGNAITTPGYYTTAGASGTSGAGVYVTGITA